MAKKALKVKREKSEPLPFGKILGAVMKERDLTLRQVAEMAGVSISVVNDWLAESSPRDLRKVSRLARCLGLSFSGLLLGEADSIAPNSVHEIFRESELFEGIVKLTVKRLEIPVRE